MKISEILEEAIYTAVAKKKTAKGYQWVFWNGSYFTNQSDERKTYKQKAKFRDAETEAKDMGYQDYQVVDRPIWLPSVK